MKLFGSLLGSNGDTANSSLSWEDLQDSTQLDTIKELSFTKPVIIYKHSTRCGISSMILSRLERSYDLEQDVLKCYFLDIIRYRSVSNLVAETFNVRHESPQLLLIIEGKAVYNTSHGGISMEGLKQHLPAS